MLMGRPLEPIDRRTTRIRRRGREEVTTGNQPYPRSPSSFSSAVPSCSRTPCTWAIKSLTVTDRECRTISDGCHRMERPSSRSNSNAKESQSMLSHSEDIQRAGVAVIAPDEERIDQADSGDRASEPPTRFPRPRCPVRARSRAGTRRGICCVRPATNSSTLEFAGLNTRRIRHTFCLTRRTID